MIPKYFFFTKGVGKHKEQLQSFELALRDAGIQMCNLVSVSSIVPPGCEQLPREKGLQNGSARRNHLRSHRPKRNQRTAQASCVLNRRSYSIRQKPVRLPLRTPLFWANRRNPQATTQKIWQQLCLQQPWASNLTLKLLGMNANNSSKPQA